jgi:two-component system response regulator HydG
MILMDIKMPMMNGIEAFREIRKIKPKIPVVMMSAFALEDLIKKGLKEGIFGIIRKPFNMEKLFSTIELAMPGGALVLIVDDDPEIYINLAEILETKGYKIKTAEDSKSSIQMARESKFDIMLIDLKLPFLDGLETHLTIQEIRPDLITIIITGYLREMKITVPEAFERGVYACLEKPIDIDYLVKYLEKVMRLKADH